VNYGALIFLGAFFALAGSWFGFVLTPQLQVGQLQQTNTIASKATYPLQRAGLARQGLEVYRANGCAYCHSQQVSQGGTICDVLLLEAGTNQTRMAEALQKIGLAANKEEAKEVLAKVPGPIRTGVTKAVADANVKTLKVAGAKADVWIVPVGPDIARGWGKRRTVAEDFLFDSPVLLGSQRIGPDLANVGSRLPDPNWHLRHLYAPQHAVKGSLMPPFRFLFETRRIERAPSQDALALPADFPSNLAPPPGYEIVPKNEAKALVAYMASLRTDASLFVAPFSVPVAPPSSDTNAPAGATNAPPTNAPSK
jgi:cbb3-type cytochrome oxidase cytochrome c subunit